MNKCIGFHPAAPCAASGGADVLPTRCSSSCTGIALESVMYRKRNSGMETDGDGKKSVGKSKRRGGLQRSFSRGGSSIPES